MTAAQADGSGLRASISAALVVPAEQRFVSYRWDREPEIVALYFGADWCGPCHAFAPRLKRIRAALREAGADTEVVYVSLDESEAEMRRYMRGQQMPWPAIDYRRLRALPAVKALAGAAPPNLVLVGRDGEVLASGWQGRRRVGLKPVLEQWVRACSGPRQDRLRRDFGEGAADRSPDARRAAEVSPRWPRARRPSRGASSPPP